MPSVDTGRKYRQAILEVGGSRPAMESFKAFRGREPTLDALLRHQGMAEKITGKAWGIRPMFSGIRIAALAAFVAALWGVVAHAQVYRIVGPTAR